VPEQKLFYSLVDPPLGCSIVDSTGLITWTPSEVQGGEGYKFSIVVSDDSYPVLSDKKEIYVSVNEFNQLPTIEEIDTIEINELKALELPIIATDSDIPKQKL